MDNFKDVFNEVMMLESMEVNWPSVGYEIADMNVIQYEHIHNDDDSFIEMLKILLTGNKERTWRKSTDALNNKAVGFPDLANNIMENTATGLTFKQLVSNCIYFAHFSCIILPL